MANGFGGYGMIMTACGRELSLVNGLTMILLIIIMSTGALLVSVFGRVL